MPLGRHRKPFSSKQKKEQLQAKRERKRNRNSSSSESEVVNEDEIGQKKVINLQPKKSEKNYNPNRFNLHFLKETQESLRRYKKDASKALVMRDECELEVDIESVYRPSSALDMPTRPAWTYDMDKEQLERQERDYFAKYLNDIFESFDAEELSYFEMNLETWRQLWRVLEISDIILLIVDIRYPALHFPPAFYKHCTQTLKKDVILVLNKIDLVDTAVVVAWKNYFHARFPNLHILLFSSSKQIRQKRKVVESVDEAGQVSAAVRALAAEIYTAKAHRELYECVKKIVDSRIDLSSWKKLTDNLLARNRDDDDLNLTQEESKEMDELYHEKSERKKFENGFVTIGCCGFPNVGKSSLLNSLNGRKVVSVSRTPGHTKHLQTIFLTKNVRLCDCPGLVFPSLVNKPLQILAGIYPIAQLQEPYSSIRYICERIPVIQILKIKHPTQQNAAADEESKAVEWSPLDVCEAWALKRGYLTAKASRPDVYRAANELLRMALDGRLCLSLKPKNFCHEKEFWHKHRETRELDEVVRNVEEAAKRNAEALVLNSAEEDEDASNESENEAYKHANPASTDEKKDESSSDAEALKSSHSARNPYALLDDE